MRKVIPAMPLWSAHLRPSTWKPTAAGTVAESDGPRVVYFPSCINRIMGGSEKGKRTSQIPSPPYPAKRESPSYNPTT